MSFHVARVEKTRPIVQRWSGYPARILHLSISHPALAVVAHGDDYKKNLYIALIGPLHICSPITWSENAIVLRPAMLPSGEEGIELVDEIHGVRVLAESFEVSENRKF